MAILVTNDDGVNAPGLMALAHEMRSLDNVYILAPDHNWSASGHIKTMDRPLRVKEVCLEDGSQAWACDGSPSDCVALAAAGFFNDKIDLVMSGVNTHANVGHDVTYSGTVAAAMEAVIWGIPAIAMSLDQPDHYQGLVDYAPAARVARQTAQNLKRYGLPANVLLNVNVPFLPYARIKGVQVVSQGLRLYHDRLDRRADPRGKPYFWVIGDLPTAIPGSGTDIGALVDGYVAVTPIQLDLTAHHLAQGLRDWDWQLEDQSLEEIPEALPESAVQFLLGLYL